MTLVGLGACGSTDGPGGTQFGPPSAEREIREAFGFERGEPGYDALVRLAAAKNMMHENTDHGLQYCRVPPGETGLNFEIFYGLRARDPRVTLNYVVVHDDRGAVICIETRHGYPPF